MRRITILCIAVALLSFSNASAQEKAAEKKKTGYAKVELMGTLHKADDKTENWTLKYFRDGVEWSIPIAFTADATKESKRLARAAKRLSGKNVIINGELFYVAPHSISIGLLPPAQLAAITVVTAQAIREAK